MKPENSWALLKKSGRYSTSLFFTLKGRRLEPNPM
jgi:hypothetical protein